MKALQALYPQLEVKNLAGVTAFFISGEKQSVIDVTYPHRADQVDTLATGVRVKSEELGISYRIPSLEAALANKYGAMLALSRDLGKRQLDVVDFTWMVKHSLDEGQKSIDLDKLAALGEMVWPSGGGQEILRMVEKVKAGQAIHLESLGS